MIGAAIFVLALAVAAAFVHATGGARRQHVETDSVWSDADNAE